jgi:hypothetical protein
MSEENNQMDDTSRDLSLSLESLECHPLRMDRGWWGIYTIAFCPEFPCGTSGLVPESNSDFFWLVAPSCLAVLPFSFDLLLITDYYFQLFSCFILETF